LWLWPLSAVSAQAQKKQLTTGQMLKNEPNKIVAPLPNITGWADDTHYIKGTFGAAVEVMAAAVHLLMY
jgi:dipeptidyl-peptidase-4